MITLDLSKHGKCIGTLQYGSMVEFWCESLDGDSTDVRIIPVTFPSVEIAAAVAAAGAHKAAG
jgi:hypothetical protein